MKESEIKVLVGLDDQKTPVSIRWKAEANTGQKDFEGCKAMFLSLFDEASEDTLKLDLWTNEMKVDDMERFIYQTIRGMADSFFKATKNNEMATAMQQFATYFGEKTGVIPSEEQQ